MSSQTGFWFPSMKISEIARALEEWGLRVSEDQIHKPTGEVVQAIYIVFLQQVTGINPESLEEPVNRAISVIEEHPELYLTSLNLNFVLLHVQRLASAARVQDFNMRDLVMPEPERTRNILSAIINFIKFAEEREHFVKKLRDQSITAQEERERTSQNIIELKRKIAEIKEQRKADEPRCLALKEENTQIEKSLIAIKKAQEAITMDVNAYKKDKSNLSRQKETLVREIELVTTSINSTRSRIVQSPDRIKKHINEMGRMAQDERKVIAANEAKSRELKIKLDALSVFEQDMKKLIDDLRAIQSEHIQVENIKHKLATFRAELDRKIILREQLMGRTERAKRQLKNVEEKHVRAQQYAEERKLKSEEELARLRREYEEMSEERKENERQAEETKKEADELEKKMQEHLKRNEAELNELLGEYWNLRHQTEVYMETLANKLGMDIAL